MASVDAVASTPLTTTERIPLRAYLGDVFWAARIIAAIALILAARSWPTVWHQVSFLVGLAILTYPARSVRWGTIYNFFVGGMLFACVPIAVQYLIEQIILGGRSPIFGATIVAATTEEVLKVLPLVLILLVPSWTFRWRHGACDLMLCAAALGCGFGLVEDALRHKVSYPRPDSPAIFSYAIFNDSRGGFVGHGGSAALIGLALGVLLYAIAKRKLVLPASLLVAFTTAWMMVDHALSNYQTFGSVSRWFAPLRWIWTLDRRGTLSAYAGFSLIVIAVVSERIVIQRVLWRLRHVSLAKCSRYVARPLREGYGYPQFREFTMRVRNVFLYILTRRQIGYLAAHTPPRGHRSAVARALANRAGEVAVFQTAVERA